MGGKGRRRREKNYRAAHGGHHSRLPPPPVRSQLDALPSKLRRLISFTSSHAQSQVSLKVSEDGVEQRKKKEDAANKKKPLLENFETTGIIDGDSEEDLMASQHIDGGDDDDTVKNGTDEKKRKKRKRKHVEDLRFETAMGESDARLKRRERKKKYLEARKKKQKKDDTEKNLNFPLREEIKFGDVVDAPPKLNSFPKALKSVQDASKERLRLQAIESYRNRKGWTSRPGINLPPSVTTTP